MTKQEIFITTHDNPFDPFTQFDDWFNYDCEKKYFTCSYIDRIVMKNNEKVLSTRTNETEFDEAIKEIVSINPETYKIVSHTIDVDPIDLIE